MKISAALLAFSLFYLSVAEVQQLDEKAGEESSTKISNIKPASVSSRNTTDRQKNNGQLFAAIKLLEYRLNIVEKELKDLRKDTQGTHVAFGASSGISGNYGPFNSEMTLIYRNVYSNTGAYDSRTGVFTAPVKGIYYFSFSGHNFSSKPMGLRLMKNGVQIITAYNHAAGGRYETATNGMTLELRPGDRVYMTLRANTWICDNGNDHSTFTGYLLFPL